MSLFIFNLNQKKDIKASNKTTESINFVIERRDKSSEPSHNNFLNEKLSFENTNEEDSKSSDPRPEDEPKQIKMNKSKVGKGNQKSPQKYNNISHFEQQSDNIKVNMNDDDFYNDPSNIRIKIYYRV